MLRPRVHVQTSEPRAEIEPPIQRVIVRGPQPERLAPGPAVPILVHVVKRRPSTYRERDTVWRRSITGLLDRRRRRARIGRRNERRSRKNEQKGSHAVSLRNARADGLRGTTLGR
jgi:hypothetical protein